MKDDMDFYQKHNKASSKVWISWQRNNLASFLLHIKNEYYVQKNDLHVNTLLSLQ